MSKIYCVKLISLLMNKQFRLRKIDDTRNYSLEEIKHNYLVSKKHKNVCKVLKSNSHLSKSIVLFASLKAI